MRVLVADIGTTQTQVATAQFEGEAVELGGIRRFVSADYSGLAELLWDYVNAEGPALDLLDRAAIAVAGSVRGGRCASEELPWVVDAEALARDSELPEFAVLEQSEALAWAVPALAEDRLLELQAGEARAQGNACVMRVGAGLGQAGMFWDGARHHPFASAGGHADFAPVGARELGLLAHLQQRFERVSWARVVSGPGIANIYGFVRSWHDAELPGWLRAELDEGRDLSAAVARAAARGDCPLCVETLELFARLLGRAAGNLALGIGAQGGVYLGGDVAVAKLEFLRGPEFLAGFLDKQPMTAALERVPVRVILDEHASLRGAARFAAR